ncbi:CHRD domain-containing protein [Fodinibius sp. AD559]|uniref:CHRD domain-containing protein n=1 Tax=Fodinibius sp. AD559 TaxID=3424179 RepID=UPI004046D817
MKRLSIYTFTLLLGIFWMMSNTTNVKAQQTKKIILAGYKHDPPVPTSGSGLATVTLHGDTLTVKGKFEDLSANYSGAYLMVSIRGQSGNQLHRLKAELNEDKTGGKLLGKENRFVLSKAQKALLKKGGFYINISSFENQKGELRGNIGPLGK